jgi:hypothetical protein
MGFSEAFKKVDIYRKLPKDLSEPTFFGAICNILTYSIQYPSFVDLFLLCCSSLK